MESIKITAFQNLAWQILFWHRNHRIWNGSSEQRRESHNTWDPYSCHVLHISNGYFFRIKIFNFFLLMTATNRRESPQRSLLSDTPVRCFATMIKTDSMDIFKLFQDQGSTMSSLSYCQISKIHQRLISPILLSHHRFCFTRMCNSCPELVCARYILNLPFLLLHPLPQQDHGFIGFVQWCSAWSFKPSRMMSRDLQSDWINFNKHDIALR